MLKWTAQSAHKMPQDTPLTHHRIAATPRVSEQKRRRRRTTICNKENIPIITSTPMVAQRTRNSPLVLAPLADILNVTPESPVSRTPERRRVSTQAVPLAQTLITRNTRRHSSVGFVVHTTEPQYATTLPKFEEEYSPSTVLPSGQQLALRGLLPDPFCGNHRYFSSPEVMEPEFKSLTSTSVPKKRKLEQDFNAIAHEAEVSVAEKKQFNHTGLVSNKMGDQTLDQLIDAILDSACKDEKKRKPRKSFNLRRRTLLKNQVETVNDLMLSPSYAAGDDPASDLSFLGCDPCSDGQMKKPFQARTPQPASPIIEANKTHTPHVGTPLNGHNLLDMPTPALHQLSSDSFSLASPAPRPSLKRRSESRGCQHSNSAKKYKVDARNYFEIGVALPSIYV